MREVKAFIRSKKAEKVIDILDEMGIADITIIDVMGMGENLEDPSHAKYSMHVVRKYSGIAKIEVVCKTEDVQRIVEIIRDAAYTGLKGDGMIYVTPVETAVKIRTGALDTDAL